MLNLPSTMAQIDNVGALSRPVLLWGCVMQTLKKYDDSMLFPLHETKSTIEQVRQPTYPHPSLTKL
jgi:hypothetical protein